MSPKESEKIGTVYKDERKRLLGYISKRVPQGVEPEDEELKELIWEAIEEVLDELPGEQSSVFIENEFEDKSFKEISEKTGIGVNTLISRKRYAVLALRERLNELYNLLKNN